MTYHFTDKCLYSTQFGTVTGLAIAPIIGEFGRHGGNFHNCYGSYMNLFFVTVIWKRFMVKDLEHWSLHFVPSIKLVLSSFGKDVRGM